MIKKYEKVKIIAEIGCNHKGDFNIAKELIWQAKINGATAVKFQKRTNSEVLSEQEYHEPHPNPKNSYGDTYGAHREFLEFTLEEHIELKKYCESVDIAYGCSVWDMTSTEEIASMNPVFIKVPSALNTNFELLGWLAKNYQGEIHISTGMTTKKEIESIIEFIETHKRGQDTILYHCTSGYPITNSEATLLEISYLKEKYGSKLKYIGYSGHHCGGIIDLVAYTLGATIIERHFTINKTWKGTDHSASLEPKELGELSNNLIAVYESLCYKEHDLLEVEKEQRRKLKWDRNQ